jgi:hypothetical protein
VSSAASISSMMIVWCQEGGDTCSPYATRVGSLH